LTVHGSDPLQVPAQPDLDFGPGPPEPPRSTGLVAWAVILLAVAGILFANFTFKEQAEEAEDDSTQLILLKLQGKLLLGMAQLPGGAAQVEREIGNLNQQASTPRVARALAALNVALPGSGEEGRKRALELLEQFADRLDDDGEAALHDAVAATVREPGSLDDETRELIREDLGWLGDVLLTHHLDAEDPERQAVFGAAFRTAVLFLSAMGGAVLALLAGLALLMVALVQRVQGSLKFHLQPPREDGAVYLEAFAVYLGIFFVLVVAPPLAGLEAGGLGVAGVILSSVGGMLWPLFRGVPRSRAFRSMGLHRGQGFLKETGSGLVGYLGMLPIVAVGFGLTIALLLVKQAMDAGSPDQVSQPVSHPVVPLLAEGDPFVRIMVLLLAVAFAPFFEEILFRGALFGHLRQRFGPVMSALVVSLVFALVHPQGWVTVPALGSLAFGFALLREWRSSLIAPMVAHGVHNGVLVVLMWIVLT
jgi:membrane protease YdiL (CAAX protease family)